ncbi:MAG: hypothetical protein QM820_65385 [Minicystis sp.]
MAAKKGNGDSKPRQEFNAIVQDALKAQGLAEKHKDEIGDRLPAEFVSSFTGDIDALGVAVPAVIGSKGGSVQLTAAQRAALDTGHKLVMGIRTTVQGRNPKDDVLLGYGVGTKTNKNVVKDVMAALTTVLDRVSTTPPRPPPSASSPRTSGY